MKNLILSCLSVLAVGVSCQKQERVGIPDTGDLRQGIVMPGHESVVLCMELKNGSTASKAEVVWGEGEKDRFSFDIPSGGSVEQTVPVPEGSYIFMVHAYDAGGREVVKFPMSGRSYGATYTSTLNNRVPLFELDKDTPGNLNIDWAANPDGSWYSVVRYLKTGVADSVEMRVLPGDTFTVLEQIVDKSSFTVRSYYYPEMRLYLPETKPASVPEDFVYNTIPTDAPTSFTVGIPIDVTSVYIRNAGPDMAGTPNPDDPRFGNLADWKVNDAAKNRNDQHTFGGWKGGHIGWEVGWGALPITNGKVWQNPSIAKGTYELTANFGGIMTDWVDMYLVVAPGAELPDIEDIPSDAITYVKLVNQSTGGDRKLTFALPEATEISIGVVITAADGDAWIDAVNWLKLQKMP